MTMILLPSEEVNMKNRYGFCREASRRRFLEDHMGMGFWEARKVAREMEQILKGFAKPHFHGVFINID